jgi:hypothetical protein
MKNCQDIENLLPLYPDGVLSDVEKQAVLEHLAGCAACRKELAYLQKTSQWVNELPAVEEPAWFQQKIMARVREEADKKSFAQKWFYPLRIKIPVQLVATIVIAVLAVYIYRAGDEQVKQILPGAPMPAVEMQKEQPPVQMPQSKDISAPAVSRKKTVVPENRETDKQAIRGSVGGSAAQKTEMPEDKSRAAHEPDAGRAKGLAESKDEAYPALQARQNDMQSVKAQMADQEKKADDLALPSAAKKKESYRVAVPAAPPPMAASSELKPEASVLVRVENLNAAAMAVEKILANFNAKKVTRQSVEGRIIVRALVSGKDWQQVLAKLKELGWVEEKIMPSDVALRDMNVLIEIIPQ